MALAPGSRLGVYEITAQIGEGGMGQVFRARDTTLNRDVALKVLPDSVANNAERLLRFTREAQTLAALNHPNIAHIHGLDESGGVRALVMEMVEGADLSARIALGPLPLEEALAIATQIALALEAAHDQGIVHRDLKPANIKVREDGTVKVLDFGLAKAMDRASGIGDWGSSGSAASGGAANSPTITTPAMTQAGVILGTAAYMSPEQAAGKTADRRSDLWSFGVVLMEMLTGRPVFTGETVPHLLASVLTRDPNWAALPPGTPAPVRKLLGRCLEKDRKRRLDSAAAARLEIEEVLDGTAAADRDSRQPGGAAPSAWARALPWGLAGVSMAALLLVLGSWAPWRPELDRPLARLDVDLGPDVVLPEASRGGGSVAISPDGTRLAYVSGSPTKLFTRRLDQANASELPGTLGANRPFFSPDGQWIGFLSGNALNKISVEGGAAIQLGEVANFIGASWTEDGGILVADAFGKGVLRMPAAGGPAETVLGLESGGPTFVLPQILPGGKAVLLGADPAQGVDKVTIETLTLADLRRTVVASGGTSPRYVATSSGAGHLLYVNKAKLFAIPFDVATLKTRGEAVPMLDDVAFEPVTGAGQFDVSRTGTLVYRRAGTGASVPTTIQWVDPSGKQEPLRPEPGGYQYPRLSPDGRRLAVTVADGGNLDVWVSDPRRDAMTRLTFGGLNVYPTWSPDGQYIVFSTPGAGIFQVRADGASRPQALTQSKTPQITTSFTPDGTRLAYFEVAGNPQIWTVPIKDEGGRLTSGKPEPFLQSNFADYDAMFSPDGRWLAYRSNESGRDEVYVRAFPPPASGQGLRWQVSNNGGGEPRWSQDGRELFYGAGDQIMVAGYTVKGDTFAADKPRVWMARLGGAVRDLAPDGRRAAVLIPVDTGARRQDHQVVVLLNFFDELRRRVPVKQ